MSNGSWSGDLNAAKEFAASVNRGGGGSRGGRSGGHSPRGGSKFSGGYAGGYAGGHAGGYTVGQGSNAASRENHAAGRRLATEPPARFWAPTNVLNNTANQNKRAEAARDDYPATRDHDNGVPMDIDTVAQNAARVLTPAMWGQPADHALAPQVSQVPARHFPQASTMQSPAPSDNGDIAPGGTTRRGAFRVAEARSAALKPTPLTHNFQSIPPSPPRGMYESRHAGNNGGTRYNRAPSPPSGMGGSRHAGPTGTGTSTSTGYTAPLKGAHLLDDHGLLKGTKFGVDQGAQNDPNWQLALTCDRLISHCGTVARAAYQADDMEAGRSLDAVVHACREVKRILHAENHLYDERLVTEARKVLVTTQRVAWPHWIKFYQPVPAANAGSPKVDAPKADSPQGSGPKVDAPKGGAPRGDATKGDAPRAQVQIEAPPQPHIRPAIAASSNSAQTLHTVLGPKLGGRAQGGFGHNGVQGIEQATRFPGFGATNVQQFTGGAAQQDLPAEQQMYRSSQADTQVTVGDFGSVNASQTNAIAQPTKAAAGATQQSVTLVNLPEGVYRDGLPKDFDDPEARLIFEDFFFQNKRT